MLRSGSQTLERLRERAEKSEARIAPGFGPRTRRGWQQANLPPFRSSASVLPPLPPACGIPVKPKPNHLGSAVLPLHPPGVATRRPGMPWTCLAARSQAGQLGVATQKPPLPRRWTGHRGMHEVVANRMPVFPQRDPGASLEGGDSGVSAISITALTM